MGWYGKWRVARALRRLTDADFLKLEQRCTSLALDAGLPMGTDDIVGGCYVGEWGDGTFFQMLIDALPKILEFIKALLPLFFMFASILLAFFVFAGTASAQREGGSCASPDRPVRSVLKKVTVIRESQPVRRVVKRLVHRERRITTGFVGGNHDRQSSTTSIRGCVQGLLSRVGRSRPDRGNGEEAMRHVEDVYLNQLMTTDDAAEGLKAVLERRRPSWKGR